MEKKSLLILQAMKKLGQKTAEQTSVSLLNKFSEAHRATDQSLKTPDGSRSPLNASFHSGVFFFILGLSLSMGGLFGCSVMVTRPVQEMAIASAALRAAREVNADAIENSKIPEMYRAAADALYKAKKEYRLKNFDRAKKFALRATLLAEKAEFEAIKAGGATPEATAARSQYSLEGAAPDPELGSDKGINAGSQGDGHNEGAPHSSNNPATPAPPANVIPPSSEAPTQTGQLLSEATGSDPTNSENSGKSKETKEESSTK